MEGKKPLPSVAAWSGKVMKLEEIFIIGGGTATFSVWRRRRKIASVGRCLE